MTVAPVEQSTGGGSNGCPKKEKPQKGAEGIRLPPPLLRITFIILQFESPRKDGLRSMPREPKQLPIPSMQSAAPNRDYKPFTPGPNPELPEFIRQHSTPYDPITDQYDVAAFSRDIVVDKAHPPKAIYD